MSIMQLSRILLVFGVFITFAYSLPAEKINRKEENMKNLSHKNTSEVSDSKSLNPLVISVWERGPKSEVMIQFVYKGNNRDSNIRAAGTNKDKYSIDSQVPKKIDNQTDPMNVNKTIKITQSSSMQKEINSRPEPLAKSSSENKNSMLQSHLKTTETSLVPEEVSPITGNWPKYLYDVFTPIQPFPELEYKKPTNIRMKNQPSTVTDSYLPLNPVEKKGTLDTAGPQLNPLSIFDREFRVPIY